MRNLFYPLRPRLAAFGLTACLFASSAAAAIQIVTVTDHDVPATMDAGDTTYIIGNSGPVTANFDSTALRVGGFSSNNELYIRAGSTVVSGPESYIGFQTAGNHNLVQVSGAGSTWTSGSINVGVHGEGNRLAVVDGGSVVSSSVIAIGYSTHSHDNHVLVSGPGSTLSASSLQVGRDGNSNTLTITDGGTVTTAFNTTIGLGDGTSGNRMLISGRGSALRHQGWGTLNIGGSDNTLTITDGGLMSLESLNLEYTIGSGSDNFIALDGGFFAVKYEEVAWVEEKILSGSFRLWDQANNTSIVGGLEDFDYFFAGWGEAGEAAAFDFTGYTGLEGYTIITGGLSAVPEPSTWALIIGLGALGVVLVRRKRSLAEADEA